jgi:hypothetical protein
MEKPEIERQHLRPRSQQATGRLIVRRVRDANPSHLVPDEQGELFPAWRHHAVFTDSPLPMVDAEADHRRHAVIEQVIADLKQAPSLTCPRLGSPPTAPGWSWPRSRST